MNLFQHVDLYCERASAAFWAEPVNAFSNLSFAVAAWAIWRMLAPERRDPGRRIPLGVSFTVPLMLAICLGSFAFHTIGTIWAQVLDVAPIAFFVFWYLAVFLQWFFGLSRARCLLAVAGFIAFLAAFIALAGPYIPNRSGTYVPVFLLLVGLTAVLFRSPDPTLRVHAPTFAWATAAFTVALVARTADESVCGSFPLGTHFLWHSFDGLLVYLASRALVLRWRTQTGSTATEAPADSVLASGR
ncbi:ceramidase domain-containing protein [Kitasatospora sp. NPDC093806]|uniref:ceramidase domain-containing protein n=1 Tax=Kitasatospora sp. NPDC093806 TaxID=3155075 RepID=UPI0034162966